MLEISGSRLVSGEEMMFHELRGVVGVLSGLLVAAGAKVCSPELVSSLH